MVSPVPVGQESVELLLLYLRFLSRKPLTPEALAADFGPQCDVAPCLVNLFYTALQAHLECGRPQGCAPTEAALLRRPHLLRAADKVPGGGTGLVAGRRAGGSFVTPLPAATEKQLHRELTNLGNGDTFALLGINNFLEGDFFGWYLDAWD